MAITLVPYGLLPNGNYGVSIDPITKFPISSVIEVMPSIPSIAAVDNFPGRVVFDTTLGALYVFVTVPVPAWKPMASTPATIGNGPPPLLPTPIAGALYWDNTGLVMYTWDGTAWQPIGGKYATQIKTNKITGDGITTVFATGTTTAVTVDYVEAYWNGVRQLPSVDFTVVGTNVTFVVPPPNGVVVHLQSYENTVMMQNAELTQVQYTALSGATVFNTAMAGANPAGILVYVNGILKNISNDYTVTQQGTAITAIVKTSATVAQATTSAPHGITIGAYVQITGYTQAEYNNVTVVVLSTPTATTFTFAVATTAPTPAIPTGVNGSFAPAQQADVITFGTGLLAGDIVDIRSFRNIVTTGPAIGEINTLSSTGGGTSIVGAKTGTQLNVKSLMGGSSISVVDNGLDVTINALVGPGIEDRVGINTSTYTVSNTSSVSYVGVRDTTAAVSVVFGIVALPTNSGRRITVKDESGGAGTNNITISCATLIDGVSTYTINTNYGSASFVFDGNDWYVV